MCYRLLQQQQTYKSSACLRVSEADVWLEGIYVVHFGVVCTYTVCALLVEIKTYNASIKAKNSDACGTVLVVSTKTRFRQCA